MKRIISLTADLSFNFLILSTLHSAMNLVHYLVEGSLLIKALTFVRLPCHINFII